MFDLSTRTAEATFPALASLYSWSMLSVFVDVPPWNSRITNTTRTSAATSNTAWLRAGLRTKGKATGLGPAAGRRPRRLGLLGPVAPDVGQVAVPLGHVEPV